DGKTGHPEDPGAERTTGDGPPGGGESRARGRSSEGSGASIRDSDPASAPIG
ncbi:ATP-dependent Clp protease ATP-binding subunit ClpB, partial [Candidatus Hakubella thermalkaliphila]